MALWRYEHELEDEEDLGNGGLSAGKPTFLSLLHLKLGADGNCGPIKTHKSVICSASTVACICFWFFLLAPGPEEQRGPSAGRQTDNSASNQSLASPVPDLRPVSVLLSAALTLFANGCETLLGAMFR